MPRIARWILARWRGLARGVRIALTTTIIALVGASAFVGHRAYEYVEHDNVFCNTCHTMADPYQRFGRSEHSKIECHDCHKASLYERTSMLVRQVAHQPVKVRPGIHAHVPNEVCVACHVNSDSTRWRQIQNTAGHRIHLESQDTALRGMQCIVCHGGTELHSFASVDQTCAKSGCHVNNRIHLGKMGDLSIYCATCHNFLATTNAITMDSLGRAISPQAQQCLSCHAMQQRLGEMEIARDPHQGRCGDCHNPHTQRRAADAVKSCTTSGCHAQAAIDTVRFHRGVRTANQCATCHRAHSFSVDGNDCLRCHAPIRAERAGVPQVTRASYQAVDGHAARPALPPFSHGDHRAQRCADCHDSREQHGQLKIRSAADCQSCHHAGETRANCASCHRNVRAEPLLGMSFTRPARNPVARPVRFAHAAHAEVRCDRCHAATNDHAPTNAVCAGCHDNHHTAPAANCVACHQAAAALTTHRLADHNSCSASGCHASRGGRFPDTRATCIVCHQRQATHQAGKNCSTCHQVRVG